MRARGRGGSIPYPRVRGREVEKSEDYVANIVVRNIWRRSRLPDEELAEVWDLVDGSRRGVLSRVEFVVGMWLIDQRLGGRKLPHRVSDGLWRM
ncbi:hypothetical protein CP532_1361 [Ophiocordyceps camponoti-leonardi (nom. inval.)]|nr:hypothetical protein CP532_1361 [Ophiocordyceps camponoti-leonardi (nom. inval.)]